MSELKAIGIKKFCAEKKISRISEVRMNKSGFPFVTLVSSEKDGDGNPIAENIYFSKRQAEHVKKGQKPSELGLSAYSVVEATNEKGEKRLKLTTSSYEDVASLL